MADFRQNKKDAQEYYETQQKIAEVIKEQTDSWRSYGDATKKAYQNAKEMAQIQREIQKLANATTAEEKAKKAELEKQLSYLQEYNKQLLSVKTSIRAIGKSVAGWGMEKLIGGAKQLLEEYDKLESSSRRVAINMGMSVTRMNTFREVAKNAENSLYELGYTAGVAGEMMGAFANETGRQVMLSEQSMVKMGQIAKRTGLTHQEMAGLVGQMEAFGMGASGSLEMIEGIEDVSNKMGVNTQNVIKKVQQNLKLVNKLNFKGGIKGMMQMAAYSEKYKISMEEVAGFADKVFRPEGAIDAAANLQVLGGSLAQMGDPFQLMYQARNAPEELAKSITKAAAATAEWDPKTKEFRVQALELDRLKEASQATGLSMDMLVETAKQTAKMNMFEDALKVDPKSESGQFLSTIADMEDGKAFIIDAKGDKRFLQDLSSSQQEAIAKELKDKKAADEEREKAIMTTQERIRAKLYEALMQFVPVMKQLDDALRGPILKALEMFVDVLKKPWVQKLIAGLALFSLGAKILGPILTPIGWLLRGRMLAKGFNAGVKQGKVLDSVMGKQGGQSGPLTKSGKPDMRYKANRVGGATQGAQGAGQMGQAAGSQATNMIKGAAAILILSAALFVFAKALQEFEKLSNGWGTLVLAATSLLVLSGALWVVGKVVGNSAGQILLGALAIGALSLALIPFGYAMSLLAGIGAGTMIGAAIALSIFAIAAALMGPALVPILLGSVAIIALSGAIAVFGLAMGVAAPGFEMFIGAFERLPALIGPMLLLGPALMLMSVGILAVSASFVALGLSLVALGASFMMGGFLGLMTLNDTAETLKDTFTTIDASAVAQAIGAINSVDEGKLEAIKSMATALSFVGLFSKGFKIEFGDLDVSGEIDLKGGGKSAEMLMEEPHLTKLKDLIWDTMEKGRGGGKL